MNSRFNQSLLTERPCPLCHQFIDASKHLLYQQFLPQHVLNEYVFSARRLPDQVHYQYLKCPHDTLVFASPVFSEKQVNDLYKISRFTYEKETPLLAKSYLSSISNILKKLPYSAKIVEVGCGNGFLLKEIKELGFSSLYGVEPSKDAIEKASPTIKKHLINKEFQSSLFPASSINLIILFQTFDHLYDPNHFLETCYTMLKPGGYLFSFHHNVDTWQRSLLGTAHPIIDVEHPALYSRRTTTAMFQKHGFLVKSVISPTSYLSVAHFLWLLPVPAFLKKMINSFSPLKKINISLKLGNIAIVGQKPDTFK